MEYGDASGTALMDVRTRTWSREILEFIDVALMDKLPELMSSREPGGELKAELAARWNLAIRSAALLLVQLRANPPPARPTSTRRPAR